MRQDQQHIGGERDHGRRQSEGEKKGSEESREESFLLGPFRAGELPGRGGDGEHVGGSGEAQQDSGARSPEEIDPGDKGWLIEPDVAIEDFSARDFHGGGEGQIVVGPENVAVAKAGGGDDYGDQEKGYDAAAHHSDYSGLGRI